MLFRIAPEVSVRHPALAIGVIVVTGAENAGGSSEIGELLRAEERKIVGTMNLESFREHPHIAALQEVHKGFGSNPNKFPPSVQALIKRVLKGGELPGINPLVDIYNIISLRHVVCAGAEDVDKCGGDIVLTYADGKESFIPLGETAEDPPQSGELVYKDDAGVICRKLNWREGNRTKITPETKNAVLVIEGFPPMSREDLGEALQQTAELLSKYCRAGTRVEILTKARPSCEVR